MEYLYFSAEFIVRVDTVTRPDGSILSVPRTYPKLTDDAYPSIFPNTPTYLSSEPAKKRKAPESRRLEISARDEEQFQAWLSDDQISSFDDLDTKLHNFLKGLTDKWIIIRDTNCICLCTVDLSDKPRLTVAVQIFRDMYVDVYRGESHVPRQSLKWVLGDQCHLVCWSQLTSLLSHYSISCLLTVKEQLCVVEQDLKELIQLVSDCDDYDANVCTRLTFLAEQFSLLFMLQPRYSAETMLIAFRFFAISGNIYNRLRLSVLSLPHVSYLKRLSTVFSLSGGLDENTHYEYLKQKAELLQEHDRHVILLLDEIYVEPKTTYKGGCVTGMATNSPLHEATTVQTFMVCSLMSKNKYVAAMVPVKNLTAAYLKECTLQVIAMLEKAGYLVFCLISDNNRVNRNMFTELCGGSLAAYTRHPCSDDRKLFFSV
jgi:hypothetical protein